jgi:hypothetical protein
MELYLISTQTGEVDLFTLIKCTEVVKAVWKLRV